MFVNLACSLLYCFIQLWIEWPCRTDNVECKKRYKITFFCL